VSKPKTPDQAFLQDWNTASSWAQSQGISVASIAPIYQMDLKRLQDYGQSMSAAERNRSILAANNPNDVTPVPSDNPRPSNVWSNTVRDAGMIFTGLEPQHLVANLFDTVKNTVEDLADPSRLAGGSAEATAANWMQNTLLSFVPGVYDLGTFLKGGGGVKGLEALAENPLIAALDVIPDTGFATKMLSATDVGATLAARAGLSTAQMAEKGVPKLLGNILMNTSTKLKGVPVGDAARGIVGLTLGDRINSWLTKSKLGISKPIQDFVREWGVGNQLHTAAYQNLLAPAMDTFNALSEADKKVYDDVFRKNQLGQNMQTLLAGVNPAVREAVLAMTRGPLRYLTETALAANDVVAVRLPSGDVQLYSSSQHKVVLDARDGVVKATNDFVKKELDPLDHLRTNIEAIDAQLPAFIADARKATRTAEQDIPRLTEEETNPIATETYTAAGKKPRALAYGKKADEARKLFGSGGMVDQVWDQVEAALTRVDERWDPNEIRRGTIRGSNVDLSVSNLPTLAQRDAHVADKLEAIQASKKPQTGVVVDRSLDQVGALAEVLTNRLKKWGDASVDASSSPAFVAVRDHLDFLSHVVKARQKAEADLTKRIDGEVKATISDARAHKAELDEQKSEMDARHSAERKKITDGKRADKTKIDSFEKAAIQSATDRFHVEQEKILVRGDNATGGTWESGLHYGPDGRPIPNPKPFTITPAQADLVYQDARRQIFAERNKLRESKLAIKAKANLARAKSELKWTKEKAALDKVQKAEVEQMAVHRDAYRTMHGDAIRAMRVYQKAVRDFHRAVDAHPSDIYRNMRVDIYRKKLMEHEYVRTLIDEGDRRLLEDSGLSKDQVADIHQNPAILREWVASVADDIINNPATADPMLVDFATELKNDVTKSALDALNTYIAQGYKPEWIPQASSSTAISEGIKAVIGKGEPHVDVAFARANHLIDTRYNVALGVTKAMAQRIKSNATIDFVEHSLVPRTITSTELVKQLNGMGLLKDVAAHDKALTSGTLPSYYAAEFKKLGLVEFHPESLFGFRRPSWGAKEHLFAPEGLVTALVKIQNEEPFTGVLNKTNKLFRYSILGLSPRYTSHMTFGQAFLVGLRSTPYIFTMLPKVAKSLRDGSIPNEVFRTPAEEGFQTLSVLSQGLGEHGVASGKQAVNLVAQEHIETVQKVALAASKPIHYLKALADINFRFTHGVTKMAQALSYLDYSARAERRGSFVDDVTGEVREMTKERAMHEGMHHVMDVFGDMRSMAPLERTFFTKLMPFYGWQRHILKYVLRYPADHPYRAMVLGLMAYENSEGVPKGLAERIQFLFMLGSPDSNGNVTAVDTRFMDPLRDVANYATLGGWLQALNPAILAPLVMIDPQMVYGSNELYPNLTYNQFYGIDVAGSQGNLETGLSQFTPQLGALAAAFDAATQNRSLAVTNPAAFTKSIFNSLNIPFAQVQHVNLKQMAAQDEIARYDVAEQAASNAWTTGDFSYLDGYASVPNPLNVDYNITPAQLQAVYNMALAQFPGQAPADVVIPPPTPPGF